MIFIVCKTDKQMLSSMVTSEVTTLWMEYGLTLQLVIKDKFSL